MSQQQRRPRVSTREHTFDSDTGWCMSVDQIKSCRMDVQQPLIQVTSARSNHPTFDQLMNWSATFNQAISSGPRPRINPQNTGTFGSVIRFQLLSIFVQSASSKSAFE